MSDPKQPKLELQISPPQALVRRLDQHLELVERLLSEADAAHALVSASFTNSLGMKMIWCPPGKFLMGSPEDEEGHYESENQAQVQISQGFWMARTPTTQGQWQALIGNNPSHFKGSKDLPVEKVSWDDAVEFCVRLNAQESLPNGYHFALPTEAQWEYACRAGTSESNTDVRLHEHGWYEENCEKSEKRKGINLCIGDENIEKNPAGKTSRVATKRPNAWGLYDMHGNVREWCGDLCLDETLPGAGPTWRKDKCVRRINRGGSWHDSAYYCRATRSFASEPILRSNRLGFRIALAPSE